MTELEKKKLEAFEIIKKKNINVGMFKCCICSSYADYIESWRYWHGGDFKNLLDDLLTQSEFDLLKEVLL